MNTNITSSRSNTRIMRRKTAGNCGEKTRGPHKQRCVERVGHTPYSSRPIAPLGGAGVADRAFLPSGLRAGSPGSRSSRRASPSLPSSRRRRGDRARCDRCGAVRPAAARRRVIPGRALQPIAAEAAEVLAAIRRRAVAGSLGSTAAELARDVGTTIERSARVLHLLTTAGHVRPDRWRSRFMPTDYAGLMARMPAVRSLIELIAGLHASRPGPDARRAAVDARSILAGVAADRGEPYDGGGSVPPDLGSGAGGGRRRRA